MYNQSSGFAGTTNAAITVATGGKVATGDKVFAIDYATKEEQINAERVWSAVSRLREIADSLFGAEAQSGGEVKAAPPSPTGRLYGLNEAQRNTSHAIDALNAQVQRFGQL